MGRSWNFFTTRDLICEVLLFIGGPFWILEGLFATAGGGGTFLFIGLGPIGYLGTLGVVGLALGVLLVLRRSTFLPPS